ncbi:MAG: hypothetical protein FWD86_02235 [Firmicutes bacterium]|nr:hypothetical protein [Bacillota bacterium]
MKKYLGKGVIIYFTTALTLSVVGSLLFTLGNALGFLDALRAFSAFFGLAIISFLLLCLSVLSNYFALLFSYFVIDEDGLKINTLGKTRKFLRWGEINQAKTYSDFGLTIVLAKGEIFFDKKDKKYNFVIKNREKNATLALARHLDKIPSESRGDVERFLSGQ